MEIVEENRPVSLPVNRKQSTAQKYIYVVEQEEDHDGPNKQTNVSGPALILMPVSQECQREIKSCYRRILWSTTMRLKGSPRATRPHQK